MSRSKIICTIGPVSANAESLRALHDAGMSVARLNGSHADLDWHRATISLIRETLPATPILLDIPGRKIRTVGLRVEPSFKTGDIIVLTTDQSHDGSEKVPVNYLDLHRDLAPEQAVLADDGTLRFTVTKIEGQDIHCRAEVDGQLKSKKGINVPQVSLRTKSVTDKDRNMIAFARETGVDFIGISFVESASHVAEIRDAIGKKGPRIVSKVENQGGLAHVAEIAEASDAIMIDRGDLSVETNLEAVALNQKLIINAAREHGKPVIVATEMLHTMIDNSYPTKAEVSDITNAILDGCAATMLSGETAIGKHAIDAVSLMRRVSDNASAYRQNEIAAKNPVRDVPQAIEDAIALICMELPVDKIVAITLSGFAAEKLATRQPGQPILAVTNDPSTARAANLLYGVEGVLVDVAFSKTSTDHIADCIESLWRMGKLSETDMVLVTAVGYPTSGNRMNLIQTHVVSDLIQSLGWKAD